MSYAVLLVEDDALIGQGLNIGLAARGFEMSWVRTVTEAVHAIKQHQFDVIVLDLGLPDADGMQLLLRLRQKENNTPVIILTARDGVEARIEGLDVGADDYVIKPVSTDELAARIRAVSRRNTGRASETVRFGNVTIDSRSRQVQVDSAVVKLTPREYSMLEILAANTNRTISTETLLARLENVSRETSEQSLKVHMHSLRKKLKTDAIETVRGVGYVLRS